ncbi:PAS domain-containing protein [Halapricum desulfuricans]|uniref:histidine kinase n=1 Tax=Halapricum desulfuricans TaxID=2841257 RepID=A0A897N1Z0_9EURY|nr:PAS domain-containing protein [Halapricum desulfuricans]QSG06684.1 Signal transduction histidine kinase, contains PAS domain [Halapricum desulfuricans]
MSQRPSGGGGSSTYHVLYADRDGDFAGFLGDRLEREDRRLEVRTVDTAQEATESLDAVDCVVVGSRLRGIDPIETIERVRERAPDLPVVLFTARGSESLASDAISAGVSDYVVREPGVEQYRILATRLVNLAEGYRAERRATAATERLAAVYERIDDAFYAVDDEWRVTYWNERMADRTGVSAADIVGDVVWDVFPEMVDSEAYERYHEAMTTQQRVTFQTYVEPLEYWIEVRVFPDEDGLSIYSREITDRKDRERALERRSEHLRRLHEITTDETASFDEQLRELLALGRDRLAADAGIVAEFDDGYTVRAADAPDLTVGAGERFDMTGTICAEMSDRAVDTVRTATDVIADAHPVYRDRSVETFVGVPIDASDGVYGAISFAGFDDDSPSVSEHDRTFVRLLAQWIGREVSRRAASQKAQTNERYLRAVIDALPQQVFVKDSGGRYLLANGAAADVYGISPAELEGSTDEEYAKESDHRDFRADDLSVIESGEAKTIPEDTFVDADGEKQTVRTEIQPLETPHGDERRALVVATDITERKRLEQQLDRSRKRLRQLVDLLPQLVFAKGESGEYLFANEGLAQAYGTTVEAIEGATDAELANSETEAEQFRADDREVIESGEPKTIPEETLTYPDGEKRVLETRKIPFEPVESDDRAVLGVATDITGLKETERELRKFEKAVESAGHGIYITDTDATIEYVNSTFEEITGYSADEAIGETPRLIRSDVLGEAYYEEMWNTILSGETWHAEIQDRRKSGEIYYADQTITPIEDDSGEIEAFVAIQRDVTERKRLEQRLRGLHVASQELSVAETVPEIAEIAVDAVEDVLELPAATLWRYDESADELVPTAVSETGERIVDSPPAISRDDSLPWWVFEHREMRVVEDITATEHAEDEPSPLRSSMAVPVGDIGVIAAGSVDVAAFDDIDIDLFQILSGAVEAAMTRAEREQQLRERERELARQNERLDEFASVVAHDLRNPLSIAIGMLDVAHQTGADEHFRKADDALTRIEELIDDILTLARQPGTVTQTSAVSLATVARESWGYVRTGNADLIVDCETSETIEANRDRLAQLLENLFRNAVEHGGEDVTIRIGTTADGFYVADDGVGIPEDARDAVFEHGYTTNDGGTGLGLSIVSDIAAAHGWTPSVTESESGGARFEFHERPT